MAGDALVLPPGTKMNAQSLILTLGILGEVFQGGLFFGWSALSIMISDQGNYEEGCSNPDDTIEDPGTDICKSQESKLALLWTLGAFSLNSGPILGGFALDYLGPRFVAIVGVCLNMLGLILFGSSDTSGFNAFIPAAIILGLGNITFHLAQFHISSLFPTKRGMITSVFVAGFTGSGTMMWFLQLIYEAAGSTSKAYTWVLIGYSFILALWIPMLWWMMPNDSFKVGEVYLLRDDWRFEKRLRGDLGRTYRRTTALQDYVANARLHEETLQSGNGVDNGNGGGFRDIPHTDSRSPAVAGIVPDSADPIWSELAEASEAENTRRVEGGDDHGGATGTSPDVNGTSNESLVTPGSPTSPTSTSLNRRVEDAEVGHESMPLPSDVSYGPLVFESRRFVELRKKTFSEQVRSTESLWMGIFYTLNVFFQQVRRERDVVFHRFIAWLAGGRLVETGSLAAPGAAAVSRCRSLALQQSLTRAFRHETLIAVSGNATSPTRAQGRREPRVRRIRNCHRRLCRLCHSRDSMAAGQEGLWNHVGHNQLHFCPDGCLDGNPMAVDPVCHADILDARTLLHVLELLYCVRGPVWVRLDASKSFAVPACGPTTVVPARSRLAHAIARPLPAASKTLGGSSPSTTSSTVSLACCSSP